MIISETTSPFSDWNLRFAISWGVLLRDMQNIENSPSRPWLLVVALPAIVVILAFNFLGDGLRDAADPNG
jgi:peptide/nickel transport system permease protein